MLDMEIERFADVCRGVANEVADEHGFVAIRNLLARFHATLLFRPLLVEGMLASVEKPISHNFGSSKWAVLVDSDTYACTEQDVKAECKERALPSRLRNTVAHELVHSLAFRPSEFGIFLQGQTDNNKDLHALVREIEQETERLSPLLLWSDKAITKLLAGRKRALTIEELNEVCRTIGISRHVLINRLRLLRSTDLSVLLHREGLRNIAIGMAEWMNRQDAALRSWPIFANFDRNIVPAFLLKLANQDHVPARTVFSDESFAMCGGLRNVVEVVTGAGVESAPDVRKMKLECSIEQENRRSGAEFLYLIRRTG